MKYLITAACTVVFALPALAQDFSANSKAKTWNLYAEVPALFEARVVDLLCEVTGDCASDCGAGKRQLGLVRKADNVLVLPMKNSQAAFTGAAVELLPFCNTDVTVDGLMIDDPDLNAQNVYLVQRIKPTGGEWIKANKWTKNWAKENPQAKGKGAWFRRDPRIKGLIAETGYTGLGLEADAALIKELFGE